MKKRRYHVLMADDLRFANLNMGLEKWDKGTSTKSGLSYMYNCRVDPDLGIGRAAVWRIPCACGSCRTQLGLPWSPGVDAKLQPRYASSTKCEFWPIFEGLNDWHVVKCYQPKKDNDEDLVDLAHHMVLEKETVRTMDKIEVGKVGAMGTNDPEADGYYLVKWIEEPYQVLQPTELPGHDPPIQVPAGEWLCRGTYYNKVGRAK
jgi:hypothetical protein